MWILFNSNGTKLIFQEVVLSTETKKKKRTFKPHYGPLRQAETDKMTESLEQREMELLYADIPTPLPPKTPETAIFHMPNSCHSIIKVHTHHFFPSCVNLSYLIFQLS